MTINELIASVFAGSNISTDDTGISKRWIYNEAKVTRAELIKQELNKQRLYDGTQTQPLQLKLSYKDISGSDDIITYGLLISDEAIPKFIETDTGLALDGIYTKGGRHITFTDKQTWYAKKSRRFARMTDVYAFIYNHHLYVDGFPDMEEFEVDVNGYFDDPVLVGILNDKLNNDCENKEDKCKPAFEQEFYAPTHIERRIIEIVRAVVFRRLGIPTDVENNDKLDTQANVSNQVQRASA